MCGGKAAPRRKTLSQLFLKPALGQHPDDEKMSVDATAGRN
jgi:hypothetical protein